MDSITNNLRSSSAWSRPGDSTEDVFRTYLTVPVESGAYPAIQPSELALGLGPALDHPQPHAQLLATVSNAMTVAPHDARGLNYFQLGRRSIQRLLSQGRRLRLRLCLPPRPAPDPVSAYGIPFPICGGFTRIPASIPAGC